VSKLGVLLSTLAETTNRQAIILVLVGANLAFNVLANASFKVSATSGDWHRFLTWQVIGNIAGFITVLTLTGLLRFLPLRAAYPLTAGLAVVGVEVFAAWLIFHEPISSTQWLGALFVAVGIALIGGH
jgi:multidrug transporter EmrE-like cation transporter